MTAITLTKNKLVASFQFLSQYGLDLIEMSLKLLSKDKIKNFGLLNVPNQNLRLRNVKGNRQTARLPLITTKHGFQQQKLANFSKNLPPLLKKMFEQSEGFLQNDLLDPQK